MEFNKFLSEALKPAVDLLFPPRCPLCGSAIAEQRGLCAECWAQLDVPSGTACSTCQRPFGDGTAHEGAQCAPCLKSPPKHDSIAAGTIYNDASRKLVLSFKHGGKIALAEMLSRLITARLPRLEGEWLLVPVPLHRGRLWARGYNQAALLAARIAKLTEQPLVVDGLLRNRKTPSLGGLGRKERERALAGVIEVNPRRRSSIDGAKVVLVDDVLTSGATSESCVRALKKAGANQVIIACFARVLDGAGGSGSSGLKRETPEV
ncbi:ComF family protein [Altererythrobacter luteolus]|uniref:ComF family protein n=1 Tax=Pontixanthobacter luteolus TaxID=295089 RepID=A0A6I4UYU6_9SPHN|nr:ComF family protein [Pontixanthobacter luteolus]MXP46675.1 ComF family protein [Pontixanthobacter luteolus]